MIRFHEDEFGQWRPICNRFGAEYLAAYHSYVQISPPEEDYDGRLDLYKLWGRDSSANSSGSVRLTNTDIEQEIQHTRIRPLHPESDA